MRKPLTLSIASRDGTLTKDSKLQNFNVDPLRPTKVVKRPAMWKSNLFAPTGQGFGVFNFNDIVYYWTDAGSSSGVIDESLMYRAFVYLGGSSYLVLPNNIYEVDDVVTIDGSSYVVDSVDGDEITVSPVPVLLFCGTATSGGLDTGAVWSSTYDITVLPRNGSGFNGVGAISNNGIKVGVRQVTTVSTWKACYWDASNNTFDLPCVGTQARADGVTVDGSLIVGTDQIVPVYWDATKTRFVLSTDFGGGNAYSVSPSGNFIVGNQYYNLPSAYYNACMWDASKARIDCALPSGKIRSYARRVNDSGVCVGSSFVLSDVGSPTWWDSSGTIIEYRSSVVGALWYVTNSGYSCGYTFGPSYTAAYFSPSRVMTTLPKTYSNSRCFWISEDGTIKAGIDGSFACYWDASDVQHFLPTDGSGTFLSSGTRT